MRRNAVLGLCAVGFAITLSCSRAPVRSTGSPGYSLDQLAKFDTSAYFIVRRSGYDRTEPFLKTEKIMGEPFTDVNGNGVYDWGIDIFTLSSDPTVNQDLNHNGRYDGPNTNWTPGLPFDDIDGNGIPRTAEDGWLSGVPYCDFNHNGRRDGDPFTSDVCRLELGRSDSTGEYFQFFLTDSTYSFTSDSLIRYIVSTGPYTPGLHQAAGVGSFVRKGDTLYFSGFPILVGDVIALDSVNDSILTYGAWLKYSRSIRGNSVYSFFNMKDSGLVHVHFEVTDAPTLANYGVKGDFYFSPKRGPIGYVFKQSWFLQEQLFHFGDRVDSVPIPMTRLSK